MNELTVFEKEEFGQVRIVDQAGEPWFVANDIASALEYENLSRDVQRHCKHVKLLKSTAAVPLTDSPRGINIIPESDVYRLIMRSNLPKAAEFQDWVCEEVLPAIRKTGQYAVQNLSPAEYLLQQAQLMVEVERRSKEALEVANQQKDRLDQIETAINYFTVIGYSVVYHKGSMPLKKAQSLGIKAAAYCKIHKVEIGDTIDQRFGRVNTYPKWVLDIIFEREGVGSNYLPNPSP